MTFRGHYNGMSEVWSDRPKVGYYSEDGKSFTSVVVPGGATMKVLAPPEPSIGSIVTWHGKDFDDGDGAWDVAQRHVDGLWYFSRNMRPYPWHHISDGPEEPVVLREGWGEV